MKPSERIKSRAASMDPDFIIPAILEYLDEQSASGGKPSNAEGGDGAGDFSDRAYAIVQAVRGVGPSGGTMTPFPFEALHDAVASAMAEGYEAGKTAGRHALSRTEAAPVDLSEPDEGGGAKSALEVLGIRAGRFHDWTNEGRDSFCRACGLHWSMKQKHPECAGPDCKRGEHTWKLVGTPRDADAYYQCRWCPAQQGNEEHDRIFGKGTGQSPEGAVLDTTPADNCKRGLHVCKWCGTYDAPPSPKPDEGGGLFLVKLTCCGRDNGTWGPCSWKEADEFREHYTTDTGGHTRTGIIVAAPTKDEGGGAKSYAHIGSYDSLEKYGMGGPNEGTGQATEGAEGKRDGKAKETQAVSNTHKETGYRGDAEGSAGSGRATSESQTHVDAERAPEKPRAAVAAPPAAPEKAPALDGEDEPCDFVSTVWQGQTAATSGKPGKPYCMTHGRDAIECSRESEARATKMTEQRDAMIELHRQAIEKHNDLLMQVANVVPGETRHETARRIIFEHENQDNPAAQAQADETEER